MNLNKECRALLEDYDYEVSDYGLNKILNTWENNKADILSHFRKHPNWNEDAKALIFNQEYERNFNKKALKEFYNWAAAKIDQIKYSKAIKVESFYEKNKKLITLVEKLSALDIALRNYGIYDIPRLEDNTEIELFIKAEIKKVGREEKELLINYNPLSRDAGIYLHKDIYRKFSEAKEALLWISEQAEGNVVTEQLANGITNRCSVKAVAGQKLSRVINAICHSIGLDKYEEENSLGRKVGYNHHFAIMSNEINPIKYKRITVISVNPIDYWTMSFGKNWASCHTIDKNNKRDCRNNHYNGCYSSGTESYMLDSSSIIYYVIDEKYEGDMWCLEDKINRCVFCLSENKDIILQSRVYPDGRDGGDDTLAGQFRAVMQNVVSELWEKNNFWTLKKGTDECIKYVTSEGTHYRDYEHYGDCNVSINKDMEETDHIYIGHDPICPRCGDEHSYEESIMCDDCRSDRKCDHCGHSINEDEAIYIDNEVYCCAECANEAGYEFCYDDDEWHDADDVVYCENDGSYHLVENCYEDDGNGYWYYGDPEVITEDGCKFHSYEEAYDSGYERDYFTDDWYSTDEMEYDEYHQNYFDPDNSNVICTNDGNYFIDEESAEDAGYEKNEDGEWIESEVA